MGDKSSKPSETAETIAGAIPLDPVTLMELEPDRALIQAAQEAFLELSQSTSRSAGPDKTPFTFKADVAKRTYTKGDLYLVTKLGFLRTIHAGHQVYRQPGRGPGITYSESDVRAGKSPPGENPFRIEFLFPHDPRTAKSIQVKLKKSAIDDDVSSKNNANPDQVTQVQESTETEVDEVVSGPYGMKSPCTQPVIQVLATLSTSILDPGLHHIFLTNLDEMGRFRKIIFLEITTWLKQPKCFKQSYVWTTPAQLNRVLMQRIDSDGNKIGRSINDDIEELSDKSNRRDSIDNKDVPTPSLESDLDCDAVDQKRIDQVLNQKPDVEDSSSMSMRYEAADGTAKNPANAFELLAQHPAVNADNV